MEKELAKAVAGMKEVEAEIERKKKASREVKELSARIKANDLEASQLKAEQQHLLRQADGLVERTGRLDNQVQALGPRPEPRVATRNPRPG